MKASTSLIIQNLDNDNILENIKLSEENYFYGITPGDFNEYIKKDDFQNVWEKHQKKIEPILNKYKIIKEDEFTLTNKLNKNSHTYITKTELVERKDSEPEQKKYDVNIFLEKDDGTKKLVKCVKQDLWMRSEYDEKSNIIYAYILETPHNDIVTIVYVCYDYFMGDFASLDYEIIGSNLNINFK